MARTEDESEAYILPTHMLIKISIELPREMQGILACCNPIPPLVKQNLLEIHQVFSHHIFTKGDQGLISQRQSISNGNI